MNEGSLAASLRHLHGLKQSKAGARYLKSHPALKSHLERGFVPGTPDITRAKHDLSVTRGLLKRVRARRKAEESVDQQAVDILEAIDAVAHGADLTGVIVFLLEGKTVPGSREGTGPFGRKGLGWRKLMGKKCPFAKESIDEKEEESKWKKWGRRAAVGAAVTGAFVGGGRLGYRVGHKHGHREVYEKAKDVTLAGVQREVAYRRSRGQPAFESIDERATNAAYAWARKMNVPTREAERRWKLAEKQAKKQGMHPDKDGDRYYAYTMGIYKKMMGQEPGQNKGGRITKSIKADAKRNLPMPRVPA